jgi:hypothetical protein
VNISTDFFDILERSLSKTRFNGYRRHGTERDALAKYLWNISLCESLCPSFQILEVAFRNSAHAEIANVLGEQEWLSNKPGFLYADELTVIERSRESIAMKRPVTEDLLIADMSFGFWTSLLDSRYDRMWHKLIAKVFPHMPKTIRTRADASRLMNAVRRLRNAALHHHSIWHWQDLQSQHSQMQTLIGHICKPSAAIASRLDRFPTVFASGLPPFVAWLMKYCPPSQIQIRTLPGGRLILTAVSEVSILSR